MKRGEGLGRLKGGHVEPAGPNFRAGEAAGGGSRDNAEIVRAALERAPEVGVCGCGGGGDGAVGEDDLVAENVGAG